MKTSDIQIRDPYIFVAHNEKTYYMFGTTDQNCWRGPGQGFDCYSSKDLENWDGPIPASGHPPIFGEKKTSGHLKFIFTMTNSTCLPPSKPHSIIAVPKFW